MFNRWKITQILTCKTRDLFGITITQSLMQAEKMPAITPVRQGTYFIKAKASGRNTWVIYSLCMLCVTKAFYVEC